ncbi:hypothetical protein MK786_03055 [Microbacterium sp. CFH 31415]|uniref:hypothetical protein n=1 Tax=Microbacterium sp. CFH 31415 TaxID=2921732 RepID=UPI001F13168F|nr:hypothetical protein [Microbacterium sp. CFH 31415]MCH6229709.1 hypothetical protein [Microbacterium sp. CFH 31415]
MIVNAIAQAWTVIPRGLLGADGADPDDPERVAHHRTAVVAALAAIVEPRASWSFRADAAAGRSRSVTASR